MILAAAVLTIPQIDSRGLGGDETRQLIDSHGLRLNESYTPFDVLDHLASNQQPLSHLMLHFWGYAAGWSVAASRLLFIFAGLLSLAMIYRLAHDFVSPMSAPFAVFAMLCSAFFLSYFAQLRFYTLVVLFASLLLWLYLRVSICCTHKPSALDWLALVFAAAALVATHGFSFVFILPVALYHLLAQQKDRRWLEIVIAGFAALALLSPLLYRMATVGFEGAYGFQPSRASSLPDIMSTWLQTFNYGSPLLFAFVIAAAIMGWRRGYLRGGGGGCFFLLLPLFIAASAFSSVATGFVREDHMRYFLCGLPILAGFYASGFYALYRLRRWLGLLMALLVLGAGLHNGATAYSPELGRPPWHLISRHMQQSDGPLRTLGFDLDQGKLKIRNWIAREFYFEQYGIELQHGYAGQDIEGRISGSALEQLGYWILFQHGVTKPWAIAAVTGALEKNSYMNCESQTFPLDIVMHTYRWKSLQCDPQPKSSFATDAGAFQHYGALQAGEKLLFAGLWQTAIDAKSDGRSISFQLLDDDWHSHAQIDLPLLSIGELRQFHFNLTEMPPGSYRLMAVVYDAQTGERQTWRGNDGWVPEMQQLTTFEIAAV